MQTSVTDSTTGITVTREVERIEIFYPSTLKQITVYFEESLKMGNKQYSPPVWLNDPLIIDPNNPKIVQAFQLLKDVIEGAESTRIREKHKINSSSSSPSPSSGVNIRL